MAGAASEDDAVSINVTPLIDIIFCLCLFFLAGFHFKQLAGRLDSWLPKNAGVNAGPAVNVPFEEVRVVLRSSDRGTEIAFGSRVVGVATGVRGDEQRLFDDVENLVVAQLAEVTKPNVNPPVIIDAEPRVPWKHVVAVLDRCKKREIQNVEFAQPMPTTKPN